MKRFEKKLQHFFELSNAQLRALRFLLLITFISFLIPNLYSFLTSKHQQKDLVAKKTVNNSTNTNTVDYVVFNPNKVDSTFLASLLLPDYVIKYWLRDISNGKTFKQSLDVLRIYGLNKKDFLRIEPYLTFKERSNNQLLSSPIPKQEKTRTTKIKQDINKANFKSIIRVLHDKKITSRTLNFRNKLGGFYSEKQFTEIYEITEKQVLLLQSNFKIEPSSINKINLDTSSFKTVLKHPYLEYEDVKIIFRLNQINNLTANSLNELLTKEKSDRISPYILE